MMASLVRSSLAPLLVLCLLAVFTRIAMANPVAIQDASFDTLSLSTGGKSTTLTPWLETGGTANANGWIERVSGFAADGQNHLAMNLNHNVWQDLGVTYQSNTRYTLTVAVGNRSGFTQAANQSRYILAASDGTIFASGTLNASTVPVGSFTDAPALVFETGSRSPAVGKTIRILLQAGGSGRSHFDKIRLTGISLLPPLATTLAATEVTDLSATLNGTVNARGPMTSVVFEYGPTTSYGSTLSAVPSTLSGNTATAVAATLVGLPPGTTFHYRVVATNEAGTTQGSDLTFTTETPAYLSGLTVSEGALAPSFSGTITSYAVQVPSAASTIRLTPATQSAGATIRVQGLAVASGSASDPIPLPPGNTVINVGVSAAGSSFSKNYRITVIRPPSSFVFTSPGIPAVEAPVFNATGLSLDLALGFAPLPGTKLVVVNNTGQSFIQGAFNNLAHGQKVNLSFDGISYPFVADYLGGSGNDLVLEWGSTRLVAWGSNFYGSLGDNLKLGESLVPVPVDTAGALSGGVLVGLSQGMHSVGFGSGDSLIAWGRNESGQLGTGNTADRFLPVALTLQGELAGKRVVSVGVGRNFTVALCSDGTLASWGGNSSGQLGDGTTTTRLAPVLVNRAGVLAGKTVTAIAVGYYTSLALCSDGTLVTWGGSGNSSYSPILVDRSGVLAGKTITSIALGGSQSYGDHSLVLCSDGTLAAWGSNSSGQVGDGTSYDRSVPVLVNRSGVLSGRTVTAIATGGTHCLALCSDGTVVAWGNGYNGRLGNGTTSTSYVPVLVNQNGVLAGKTITSLAAGADFSMALCSDGTLAAWGNNASGRLGNNSTQESSVPVLVNTAALAAGDRFQKVGAGIYGGYALVAIAPPPIVETVTASQITDTTATLSAGVNANGTATTVAFEYGPSAAYGAVIEAAPSSVTGSLTTTVGAALSGLVSGTTYHYRVVTSGAGGTVKSEDRTFVTGDAASLTDLTPNTGVLVPSFDTRRAKYNLTVQSGTAAVRLTPQTLHPAATVKVNGNATTPGTASDPVVLGSGDTVVSVEVMGGGGTSQTYQIVVTRLPSEVVFSASGTTGAVAEGFALDGPAPGLRLVYAPQPGTLLTLLKTTGSAPVEGHFSDLVQWQIVNLTYGGVTYPFVINYRGGDGNDVVLEWANRRLVAWGENVAGQLGDGSTTNRTLPVPVSDDLLAGKVMTVVGTGYRDSLALCTDGTLAAWGSKSYGSIGDGTTSNRKTPIDISQYGVLADKTVIGVADGWYHGMAWCANGTLAGWGYNSYGQVGTGKTGDTSIPTRTDQSGVLAGKTIKAMACGVYHTLALCTDGTLAGWGANGEGQLGFVNPGTSSEHPLPTLTGNTGVLADKTITAIAAGNHSSMALCSDGTLVRWGNLDGSNAGSGYHPEYAIARPVYLSGVLAGKKITAISASGNYGLMLFADGSLAEWSPYSAPVLVNSGGVLAGKTVTSMSSGTHGNYVMCSDGSLVTWSSYSGSVSSPPALVSTSTLAPGERFMGVSSGNAHSLAITARPAPPGIQTLPAASVTDNSAILGGMAIPNGATTTLSIEFGKTTGYGTTVAVSPAAVSGTTQAAVTAAIANLIPGTTYHYRLIGQSLGGVVKGADVAFTTTDLATLSSLVPGHGTLQPGFDPKRLPYSMTVPYVTSGLAFTPVATHSDATVRINGQVVASGQPSQELPLAVGNTPVNVLVTGVSGLTLTYQIVVTRLPATFAFAAANTVPVTAGDFQAVGEAAFSLNFKPAPGTVLTVVNNTGNNPVSGRFSNLRQWQTVNLTYGGVTYPFVADYFGGTGNDLVLRWGHQRLLAWGANSNGQIGDGTVTNRLTPTSVGLAPGNGRTVVATAIGSAHCLALRSDGVLFAWGSNEYGQLGTGDKVASNLPMPVDTEGELAGRTILSLAVDGDSSFALCEDGSLFAWGGSYGLLPVRAAQDGALAGKSIAALAVGRYHCLALCTDGTLAAWGSNSSGQLGDGTGTNRSIPVLVNRSTALAGKEVIAIAAGGAHSMALCSDGTLAAWGEGPSGQIGTTETAGLFGSYLWPAAVSRSGPLAGKTIQAIAAGSDYSLALCTDGTLTSWGDNWYGQLGNGTTTDATVPVKVTTSGVLSGKTVASIAAGFQHSLALCSDGTLAAWGANDVGQLGDGTTTSRSTPVLVLNGARAAVESIVKLTGGLSSDSMVVAASPPPPTAETLAATGLGDTSATLNGRVNGAGASTTISFEYGLTTGYGSSVAGVPATVTGNTDTAVGAAVANLMPGTTYHYRVVASGPGGVVKGADQTLTTTDLAKLVSLTIDGAAALAPGFSSGIARYETTVANATTSVTVTPVAAATGATVRVNGGVVASGSASGPLALAAGSNTITVAVTAAGQTRSYVVVVTRLPATMAFASSAAVPATAAGFSVGGLPVQFSLGFAPPVGSQLTVLKNTGAGLIQGTFANLAQWQVVSLSYNNIQYPFVANYFGGTGNDLVLEWAGQRLLSWGNNGDGRLGDGSTVNRTLPGTVADGALAGKWIVRSVAGRAHNLALAADGSLAAWGSNASGQLGTGDAVDRNVPAPVELTGVLAGKTPIAFAAGESHSLVLCGDGTLAAWGLNDQGQLGDGTTTNRLVPVRVEQAGVLAGKLVVAIACGSDHCLVWCSDGTLAAWGDNSSGQLGDGTRVRRATPVRVNQAGVLAGKTVAAISSGTNFNLALCADGSLAAWGGNLYGQLGNGSQLDAVTPVLVDRTGVLAGKTLTAIACGGLHGLALCSDSTLASWGYNSAGQLGNGTIYDYTGRWVPVLVTRTGVLSGKTVAAIAGGYIHSLALCSDGTLTAWGNNSNGELGNNTTTSTGTPVLATTTALRAGERFVAVAGGHNHSLAALAQPVPPVVETLAAANLKDTSVTLKGRVNGNGSATTVAFNYGLTSDYGTTATATPTSVSGTTATAVSAALSGLLPGTIYHFRCVGTAAGRAVYGNDQTFTTTSLASLAGLTPNVGSLSPVFDPRTTRYDVTLAGAEISLTPVTVDAAAAVTVNGTAVASGTASPTIVLNPGSNTITVAVTGSGGNTQTYQVIATRLPAMMTFSSASDVAATAGGFALGGLTADFRLGFNPAAGTLLTVLRNTGNLPIQGRFTNLAQGQVLRLSFGGVEYPFVVNYQGGDGNDLVLEWGLNRLVCWGNNQSAEIGDGTSTSRSVPTPVGDALLADQLVTRIVAGGSHAFALCADGSLVAWGGNSYGQYGDGSNTTYYRPVVVPRGGVLAGQEIVGLWAGRLHSVALLADGSLAAWGENGSAQLGDGTTTHRNVPVRVKMDGVLAGKTVRTVSCGATHTLVLCTDGTLAAWGDNSYGSLGNGGTVSSSVPVAVNLTGVLADKTVTAISAGYYFNLAACADGTVVAWGHNTSGQLGNGGTSNSPVPVLVTPNGVLAGKTVTAVSAGETFGVALCADGTLAAWGANTHGQLGNGTTTNSSVPVLVNRTGVLAGKTVTTVSAAQGYGLAFCADGTIATWGGNYNGQLGDNSTTNRSLPVLVNTSGLASTERFTMAQAWGSRSMALVGMLPPPVPETLAASAITGVSASLAGRVSPSGNNVTVAFEYGLTTGYGSTVDAVPATASGTAPVSFSASLSGLLPATTYHYRAVVTRSGRLFYGADASFTTSDAATLANLVADGGSLFPGFAPNQMTYQVTVPNAAAGIALTPTTMHPAATVRINGQAVVSGTASETLPLAVGGNTISAVVTGEDGGVLTYQVSVTRLPAKYVFDTADTVPVIAGALTAVGDAAISLNFAPLPGTHLTVVDNTGAQPIQGRFANLAQWQVITLSFGGIDYPFAVNYYGGTGNDLVLEWANRRLLAWGANSNGRLGDGTTGSRSVPAPVLPGVLAGKTIVRVVAGGDHNLALASDGTLAAWGNNAYGQLGDNSTTDRAVPVAVDISGVLAGKTIIGLVACSKHSVAVCADGSVATWGANDKGQLGNGTTEDQLKPVLVDRSGVLAGKVVIAVTGTTAPLNSQHCLALCADGTLVAWGFNGFGQLGDGTNVTRPSPVRVNQMGVLAGKSITTIAAGSNHSAVLCSDGSVVTWGYNVHGNLGDGTTTGRYEPAAVVNSGVLAGKTVVGLSTCSNTCLVRCSDGTLATWGYGSNSQLGNGQTTYAQTTPVLVTSTGVLSGKTPVNMASGTDHHLVGCSDGTLVAWGYNSAGQLGDGTSTNRSTPVLVTATALRAGERIAVVSAGSAHSLAWVASPPPPALDTLPASDIADSSATLHGQVTANGTATTVAFEYGPTAAYGMIATASPASVNGTTPTAVSASLSNLLSGTTYHFRVIAPRPGGNAVGGDETFTTTAVAALAGLTMEGRALQPAFDPNQLFYQTTVANTTREVTLTPVTADDRATVKVNGTLVASGTASQALVLAEGDNTIVIEVTGAGGATQIYQVAVTRLPSGFVFADPTTVPFAAAGFSLDGLTAEIVLQFAPLPGSRLTLLSNTGTAPIHGGFTELAHGQTVDLIFEGIRYPFVANYFGGDGNDLVLQWANSRIFGWGSNFEDQLDTKLDNVILTPFEFNFGKVLAGKVPISVHPAPLHNLILFADGTLAAWGANNYGQLGDGGTASSAQPVAVDRSGVLAGKVVVGASAGGNNNLVLCSDGSLASWGQNSYGILGDGSTTTRLTPVAVDRSGVLAERRVVAAATTGGHCLALCADGTLAAWGRNNYGQLGDNSTGTSLVPIRVDTTGVLLGRKVTRIAAGGSSNLALCEDGTLVSWGGNDNGQLGDGTTTSRAVPVLVDTSGVLSGKTVVDIAAGANFSMALCADGTLAAWGAGGDGQLGNGSTGNQLTPVAVNTTGVLSGKTIVGIQAGSLHSMAICSDGTVAVWGDNYYGQLGDGSRSDRSSPGLLGLSGSDKILRPRYDSSARHALALVPLPPLPIATTLAAVAVGDTEATLLGRVAPNGSDTTVRFEYGLTANYGSVVAAVPSAITAAATTSVSVEIDALRSATTYHYRVVASGPGGDAAGEDRTFTTSALAALAGLTMDVHSLQPAFDPNQTQYSSTVAAGVDRATLTPVTADAQATVAVNGVPVSSGTASQALTLVEGNNLITVEVTGTGGMTRVYQVVVTRLPAVFRFSSASMAQFAAAGYLLDGLSAEIVLNHAPPPGTALKLLDNTGTAPIQGRFTNLAQGQWVKLTFGGITYPFVANYFGGDGNDLVLEWANNRLLAWGKNDVGQVDDSLINRTLPTAVTAGVLAGKTIIRIACGSNHNLALCTDGTLAAWGENAKGQLGDGSTTDRAIPVLVDTAGVLAGKQIVAIAAGEAHSMAVCADGTLAAWGDNSLGQLGEGSSFSRRIRPVLVDTSGVLAGKSVVAVAGGGNHTLALCADGTLAAWGHNTYSQLGAGIPATSSGSNEPSPVLVDRSGVLAGKSVVAVTCGLTHSIVLCADGTVASWGYNGYRELGDGTGEFTRTLPVMVDRSGVLANRAVTAIATQDRRTLALCDDGTLVVWGYGYQTPTLVEPGPVLAGKTIAAIAVGESHRLVLTDDRTLATWGANGSGQLGDGTTTSRSEPTAVLAGAMLPGERPQAMAGGQSHSLMLVASPPPPVATALAASDIGETAARLNGEVNASGTAATVTLEYGLTTNYGSAVPAAPVEVTGAVAVPVSAGLTGLRPGSTYHYRVVAARGGVVVASDDMTFTTTDLATLADLTLGGAALSPEFAPAELRYLATVAFATDSITLTPTATHATASVRVNGAAVVSGASSQPLALAVGENSLTVAVTASGGMPATTYTVVITRLPETFNFDAASDVPLTLGAFAPTGRDAAIALNFAPQPGTALTMVDHTGAGPITGTFANLANGQTVRLVHGGVTYPFVANYFGGDGNDLVLQWANTRLLAWGAGTSGQLGNGGSVSKALPVAVIASGVLRGKTVIATAAGSSHSLALCIDGTLATWGSNQNGQLGTGKASPTSSSVPVAVERSGVLAGKTISAIAAGGSHNLVLCTDGTLAAWGYNNYGQLGNGTFVSSTAPVLVNQSGLLAGKTIIAIAAGGNHSLALCADGTLAAWGYNSDGQLGDATNASRTTPMPVDRSGVLTGKTIIAIASGTTHSLALCDDGTLAAWGSNASGQLGDNTTTSRNVPVLPRTGALAGKTIMAIAGGGSHSLALCTDGTLAAWGANASGQLGNGTTTLSRVPVLVDQLGTLAGRPVISIHAGSAHSLVFCEDGFMAGWGDGGSGQLGSAGVSTNPVPIIRGEMNAGDRLIAIASGNNHNLALAAAAPPPIIGTLAASGILDTGATLNGSVVPNGNSNVSLGFEYGPTSDYGYSIPGNPAVVDAGTTVATSAVIAGLTPGVTYHFRCVASADTGVTLGEDFTFTTTTFGTLAGLSLSDGALMPEFSGIRGDYLATVPFDVGQLSLTPVLAHASSAVTVNGVAVASGTPSAPIVLAVGGNVIEITVVAADGVNTRNYRVTVTRLPGLIAFGAPDTVPASAAGFRLSGNAPPISLGYQPQPGGRLMVLDNTGTAPIDGAFADLAQGQTVALTYGGTTTHFVANYFGGSGNDLVLEWANRRLLAWGDNAAGYLGNGSTSDQPAPLPVDMTGVLAGKTVIDIAAGYSHTLALCSDGTVAAWGDNRYGELGDGTTVSRHVPVQVNSTGVLGGKKVIKIAAGGDHSLALCTDGTLAAWGQNSQGELGDGTTSNRFTPVPVDQTGILAGKSVVAIAAGERHCLILCGDGTLVAWGYNDDGQLGDGTWTRRLTPVQVDQTGVLAGKSVVAIAAGAIHNMVLCSDGTVAGWGFNYHGQLGTGDTNSKSLPAAVDQTGVLLGKIPVAISVDTNHSLIACADGSVAACGYNEHGKLGDGTTTARKLPVLVDQSGALAGKLVIGLGTGYSHSVAWCADGTAAAWGLNSDGQLGTNRKVGGTLANSATPALVDLSALVAGERMVRIDTGLAHNLALSELPLPGAETLAATAISGIGSTLHGRVNALGNEVSISFEYGVDETYGNLAVAAPGSITGVVDTAVTAPLAGLKPGTTYHYRVVVSCDGGIIRGEGLTFTTLSDNAKLAALTTSAGNPAPAFEKLKFDYLISVANSTDRISITPVTDHPGAKVRIGGDFVPSGTASQPLPLEVGSNTIPIFITAEDTITTLTYTLVVTRLPAVLALDASGAPPVTADGFFANNLQAMLRLNFHPSFGSTLMVVNNTSLAFIHGRFANLAHGQRVWLTHDGASYAFVANYYGGTGNDLVLQWAGTRVASWGMNNYGQLGDGGNAQRLKPIAVDDTGVLADKTIFAMSTGYLHSVALCSDGTLASWGYNVQGQLGGNGTSNSSVPVAVDNSGVLADKVVVAIASGSYHNLALCSDGTIASWGFNNHGQLGDSTKTTARTPVLVNTEGVLAGKQVVAIAAGTYQSYALCSDGTLAAWGYNDEGELGNGGNTGSLVPVAVDKSGALAGRKVSNIAAGQYHALALCTDGTLVSWGYNQRGQLGNNSTADSKSPVEIGSFGALAGKSVKAIAAGASHSLALCTDGTLAAWGTNSQSQLGVTGITQSTTPIAVTPPENMAARVMTFIMTGAHHNLLRFTDGSLAAWGGNTSGQLGSNNTQASAAPVNVDTSALDHGGFILFAASGCASSHNLAVFAVPVALPAAGLEAWRLEYFGHMEAGNALSGDNDDCDHDGIPNLVEYAFQLDPHQNSAGELPQPHRVGDRFELRFSRTQAAPDIEYGAEWSPDLSPGSWRDVPESGDGEEHVFSLPVDTATRLFMRHRVSVRDNAPE